MLILISSIFLVMLFYACFIHKYKSTIYNNIEVECNLYSFNAYVVCHFHQEIAIKMKGTGLLEESKSLSIVGRQFKNGSMAKKYKISMPKFYLLNEMLNK